MLCSITFPRSGSLERDQEPVAGIACEGLGRALVSDEIDAVGFAAAALAHSGRAKWHLPHGEAHGVRGGLPAGGGCRWPAYALDEVTADERGVAGDHPLWHAGERTKSYPAVEATPPQQRSCTIEDSPNACTPLVKAGSKQPQRIQRDQDGGAGVSEDGWP